jgi:protein TonB
MLAVVLLGACATRGEPVDQPLCQPRPVYPAEAAAAGVQGDVVVRVNVDTAGRMRAISVVRSSGHEALDKAAMEAIDATVCSSPPMMRYSREPVEGTGLQPVAFRLSR